LRDEGLTNRTFAALTAGGLACLLALGTPSGAAAAAEREASDDDLPHWLLRPRWQRHVPESPASPSVVEVALDHVTVSWTAPEGGAFEIVDYDVQFRPTDADGFSAWTHEGAATETTVTGLERGTAYEFVCAPRTRRGRAAGRRRCR